MSAIPAAAGVVQRAKTRLVLGFLPLDKSDTLAQDFAGVLVTARDYQTLDETSLVIG